MKTKTGNYAFIDSQNLNLAIREQGWILDFKRFRVYLKDKYKVSKAFIFIGYIEENKKLYDFLERVGYVCIFKPTLKNKDGVTKGNCDAELVLQAMIEYSHYKKAIIVTGDGDFYCLAKYLIDQKKMEVILIPNENKFSALLYYKVCRPFLRFVNQLRGRLEYKKEKAP